MISNVTFGKHINYVWNSIGDSWKFSNGKYCLQQPNRKKNGRSHINGVGLERAHFDLYVNNGAYHLDLCKNQIEHGEVNGRLISDLLAKFGEDGLTHDPNGDRLTLEMKDGIVLIELARDIRDFIEGYSTPQE